MNRDYWNFTQIYFCDKAFFLLTLLATKRQLCRHMFLIMGNLSTAQHLCQPGLIHCPTLSLHTSGEPNVFIKMPSVSYVSAQHHPDLHLLLKHSVNILHYARLLTVIKEM